MPKHGFVLLQCLSFFLLFNISILSGATDGDRKLYIVYMGSLPEGEEFMPSSYHLSMLQEVVEGSSLDSILVRSYKRSFNGFAAKLTNPEREKLASMEGVVSVFPSRTFQLHTTRSWDFMGFDESITRKLSTESDVIVGVLDSGIWPESESFSDEGFGPPPKKWKGACNGGQNFTCNNKLIGARFYPQTGANAIDEKGHGSHTASTAAGNKVEDASFFGVGRGTARGGVPSARIAAYKVCNTGGCAEEDILAGFDDAIADGVDLITISLGPGTSLEFYQDTVAIGSFHAMAKGILTVNSAGNGGPSNGTTASASPWMLSVAGSTTDRLFIDKVVLGNGKTLVGYSINSFTMNGTKFPLIHGKEVKSTNCSAEPESQICFPGCIDGKLIKGKIVVCDQFQGGIAAKQAGAEGSILKNDQMDKVSFTVPLPASALAAEDYNITLSYLNSTRNPEGEILKTEVMEDSDAPVVAPFSSRGPSRIVPDIIKPDITAPGVDILAAYSPIAPLAEDGGTDRRLVKYNIISGTSMSCPHVAGVAAYVKSFHPDWSPSAIKSAIMTTAWPMSASKNPEAEFAYGSGHINPVKAINPGLVYDAVKSDYIKMLCGLGFDEKKLGQISGENITCPKSSGKVLLKDLNYPSMASEVLPKQSFKIRFRRTVTNVGLANSTYKAKIFPNSKIGIKVVPQFLSFKSFNEKQSFDVTVTGRISTLRTIVSSSLVWSDSSHSVRSPILVHTMRI